MYILTYTCRAITDFPAAPLNGTSLQFAGWSSSGHALVSDEKFLVYLTFIYLGKVLNSFLCSEPRVM